MLSGKPSSPGRVWTRGWCVDAPASGTTASTAIPNTIALPSTIHLVISAPSRLGRSLLVDRRSRARPRDDRSPWRNRVSEGVQLDHLRLDKRSCLVTGIAKSDGQKLLGLPLLPAGP